MTKDDFLSKRWNNILSIGLGIPLLVYVSIVLFSSVLSSFASFIGIVIFGVVY